MDAEIEQAKLQLPHYLHPRLEVPGGQHFGKQGFRQGFASLVVTRDQIQGFPIPTEVFHELARQFHRIPLHPTNAGHAKMIHAGQHMVETVTELME